MDLYAWFTFFLTFTVLCGYLNYRFLKLPSAIGLTLVAFVLALLLLVEEKLWPARSILSPLLSFLAHFPFEKALLHWMLGFLLFAGALHVELETLMARLKSILSLATLGVFISTGLTAGLVFLLGKLAGLNIPFIWALLFGALIAPTDPVAVLSLFKKAGVEKEREIVIVGESLLNDGVAVVLFLSLLEMLKAEEGFGLGHFFLLLGQEAVGGLLLGGALGYLSFLLLKSIDDYELEVLITLALVMLCFTLAERLHLSGPLAVVAAGLLIGNHGRRLAMSPLTVEHVDTFWRLIDSLLNAVLFLLVGLEVLLLSLKPLYLLLALASIPAVLAARFLSVGLSLKIVRPLGQLTLRETFFFTWAGLRGGIALALCLSLPQGSLRELFLHFTYLNVLFSVLVQGLSIPRVAAFLKN